MTTNRTIDMAPKLLPEVTVSDAAEVLEKGLILLRSWTTKGWALHDRHREKIHQLIDDLHNHPAFIAGNCPEEVIRKGNARALAIIIESNKNPAGKFPPPPQRASFPFAPFWNKLLKAKR